MAKKPPIIFSAVLLTGVNLLLRLVSTSFQVYISSKIGASGVGLLQLVLSVGSLAITFAMAGIRTTAMYLTAGELGRCKPEHVGHVLSGCIRYSILCSGSVCLLLFIFAPTIAQTWIGYPETTGAIRLLAFSLPVGCLCGVMTGYFTAAGRIGSLAAVEVAEQLFSMVATLTALTLWADTDPGKACQAVVMGSALGSSITLLLLTVLRLAERPPKAVAFPLRKKLLDTALPLALADDLKAGLSSAENLMVPKRLALYKATSDPLAVFGTVCGMVFPVLMFPAAIVFSLAELLIPEMASCAAANKQKRIRYLAHRSLRTVLLYSCLIAGEMHLLAYNLCHWLYRNPLAGEYLSLYAILIPMLYCDAIIDAMNKGLGQQKICVRYNILTAALDLFFLYLLLPRYGMMGYFYSFLVTHLLNFILSLRLLLKTSGLRLNLRTPALTAIATVAAVLPCHFLTQPLLRLSCFVLLYPSVLTIFCITKGRVATK